MKPNEINKKNSSKNSSLVGFCVSLFLFFITFRILISMGVAWLPKIPSMISEVVNPDALGIDAVFSVFGLIGISIFFLFFLVLSIVLTIIMVTTWKSYKKNKES